jgi:hypothetical protein
MRLCLALALAIASGCSAGPSAPPASPTPSDSGIQGAVLAGPTCPVERLNSPCPPRPLAGWTVSAEPICPPSAVCAVARPIKTRTDSSGRYRLPLAPGTYTVTAAGSGQLNNSSAPKVVTVTAHAYAVADLMVDTGIR